YFHIPPHAWTNVDPLRTQLPSATDRKCGMHTEFACLVRTCRNDTSTLPALWISADDYRLSFVFRLVELFDGCIKGIHVHVKDGAHAPGSRVLSLSREF